LNHREYRLLKSELGGDPKPLMTVRSTSRVDTGGWLWRRRLWVCVSERLVTVLAASRRTYVQSVPRVDCQDSRYCHTTGELILSAGEELRFSRLAMKPADALRVLEAITQTSTTEDTPS